MSRNKKMKQKNKNSANKQKSALVRLFDRSTAFVRSRLVFESFGIVLIAVCVFLIIALATVDIENDKIVSHCGTAGAVIASYLINYVGVLAWSVPIVMAVFGVIFFRYRTIEHKLFRFIGFMLFVLTSSVFSNHLIPDFSLWPENIMKSSGGRLGEIMLTPLQNAFGTIGTTIVLLTFLLISIIFMTGISYNRTLSIIWAALATGVHKSITSISNTFTHIRSELKEKRNRKAKLKHQRASVQMSETVHPPVSVNNGVSGIKPNDEKHDSKEPIQTPKSIPDIFVSESDNGLYEDDEVDLTFSSNESKDSSQSTFTRSIEYELPDISILDDRATDIVKESRSKLLEKSEQLLSKLKEFNVEGRITEVCPGPVITRYEFAPAPGVKIAKVSNLANDLALGMRSKFGLRVIPTPGKSTLGIEIPNAQREIVNLKDILLSEEFRNAREKSVLSLPLGKDTAGRPFISDLKRMPHLLIAGATGSGKSVCINTLLAGLLFISRPDQLRLLLIDPKMLELSDFNGIPHLREPVITEPKKAPDALNWAVAEMERRFRLLADNKSRNIDLFNAKVTSPDYEGDLEPLPYLVIVIDELADLMLTAAATVEEAIQRLSQMARAAGIHLIIATQRPSVDVITGVIKANLPCRLAFQVASKIDSRTILDGMGAETLVGMGDSIFVPPGRSHFMRLHGAFINESEIQRLVAHLRNQPSPIDDEESIFETMAPKEGEVEDIDDPIYEDAVRLVLTSGVASISMLQRRLKIGHSRASRLIDIMELSGLVGPHIGSKTREILVEPEEYLERMNEIRETGAYD